MKLPVALALVIGVAGAVIAYLYLGPLSGLGLFVPATFLGARPSSPRVVTGLPWSAPSPRTSGGSSPAP